MSSGVRPASVPASGSTVERTRAPMLRKTASQSAGLSETGVPSRRARPDPLENLGSTLRRRRRRRSTTIVLRYGCCIAHTRSMSCGMGMLYGSSTPRRTRASARSSVSSVRSWRLSCSSASRISSSRRRLERRSLSSPRWSMADSLMSCSGGQRTAYVRGAPELTPWAGALQDQKLELALDKAARGLRPAPAERGILVAPKQRRPYFDRSDVGEPLPGRWARREIGPVVVEGRCEPAWPRQGTDEAIDDRLWHRV